MPTLRNRSGQSPLQQFDLFQPRSNPAVRPSWTSLPPEVQGRVVELLTQLLQSHPNPPVPRSRIDKQVELQIDQPVEKRIDVANVGKEARDERSE